jgi:hypothetical protein
MWASQCVKQNKKILEVNMANNKETALAVQESSGYLSLANTDFSSIVSEELDGLEVSFEKIKIPSGGAIVFEVPNEDGDVENVKEFSGVILHHHPISMYYKTKYTGGSNPPDCGSFDGKSGEGDPGGLCQTCPNNQYGTGENGAKACKNRQRIYILREGEIFPILLSLPTGSLKSFSKYLTLQLSKGRRPSQIVTRFSLKKATNNGGIQFSQMNFKFDRSLSAQEIPLVAALAEQVKAFACKAGFDAQTEAVDESIYVNPDTGEIVLPL